MTIEEVARERKRLQDTWEALNRVDDTLDHAVQAARADLRTAYRELLRVDQALQELEGKATEEQTETAGGAL
jgi:ABC-type transporter Mla subunit MlaD